MSTIWWQRWLQRRSPSSRKAVRGFRKSALVLETLEDRSLLSFAAPVALDLPGSPTAVATGHFEGSHAPLDAVTADANGDVSVLLGKGDGTLQVPVNLRVGGNLTSVAVGDLLGNGLDDIVAANSDDTVSVLLSNGNGTFQNPKNFSVGATPRGVAVANLGNGRQDIVTANSNGTVSVLLNSGNGSFQSPIKSQVGDSLTSLAIADFNGDGKADLVVGSTRGLSVLLGNGGGSFQLKTTFVFPIAPQVPGIFLGVNSVAVGAFRSNGKQDIVANASGETQFLLGNGDGTFQAPVALTGGGIGTLAVGDFTGDGKPDIVASTEPSPFGGGPGIAVLAGNGNGTFQLVHTLTVGETASALAAGDFNNDGKLDLAFASNTGAGNAGVLLNAGGGVFVNTPAVAAGGTLPSALAAGDFTGDGKPDLVATGIAGNAVVELNNGDGTFRTGPTLPVPGSPTSVVGGDFNGDGRQDIAVGTQAGRIEVFLGNGNGTFKAPLVFNLGINESIRAIVPGKFGSNGRLDLAVTTIDQFTPQGNIGQLIVLLGNGNGTFQKGQVFTVGDSPEGLATADLNGDGKLDLLTTTGSLANGLREVKVLLGNGNGTFQKPVSIVPGGRPTGVAVGDFTGDGKPDLLLIDRFNNTVSVLPGSGNGTFGAAITTQLDRTVLGLGGPAVGDFFKDGRLSVAVTSSVGTVSVLHGNGDGTFQAPIDFLVGFHAQEPSTVIAADFNGDGKLDLAATNFLSNDVSVLLNTTVPVTVTPVATTTALAADVNPAVAFQAVTLTATVASLGGVPTGTVTFFDGTRVLGQVAVDPNGHALLTVQLAAGPHALRATFAGTGAFSASASAVLSETVNRTATATTLAADIITVDNGIVLLQATVVPVAPGGGVPTGTITFRDGTTILGTVQLDAGGQAYLLLEGLAVGTHTITASYSGDLNDLASISDPLKLVVS
jgi:hypothetical protein